MKERVGIALLIFAVIFLLFMQPTEHISVVADNNYINSLTLIKKIRCGSNLGTMSVIDNHHGLTAAHVVFPAGRCEVGDQKAKIIYANPLIDMAVVEFEDFSDRVLPTTCDGVETDQKYYAMGYVNRQKYFVVEPLIALKKYGLKETGDSKFTKALPRIFEGSVYHGMSGGPIMNDRGEIAAMTLATFSFMGTSYALGLDLKDTVLCNPEEQGYMR